MAYPGGFSGCPETPPAMIFLIRGFTSLHAPTFTSHLNLRLLETPLETNSGYATAHGSKSNHRLRKWNSPLQHASSLKSFRTAFTHEHRNCKTGEGNDTTNARMLATHEIAFDCYDSCRESERYRSSVFLVFSLHTRTYTKCI